MMSQRVVQLRPGRGAPRAPLVPPETDLRGFRVAFDVSWLLAAHVWLIGSGDAKAAAAALAIRSAAEVPAGTLPNDDAMLATLSGAGAAWPAVRELVLRDWLLCSDGRLHCPALAEQVREAVRVRDAGVRKRAQQDRKNAWRTARKEEVRAASGGAGEGAGRGAGGVPGDVSGDDSRVVSGDDSRVVPGDGRGDAKTPPSPLHPPTSPIIPSNPLSTTPPPAGGGSAEATQQPPAKAAGDSARIGAWSRRAWWRRLQPKRSPKTGLWVLGGYVLESPDGKGAVDQVLAAARLPVDWNGDVEALMDWLAEGWDLHDAILPAIRDFRRGVKGPVSSLRLFDTTVRSVPKTRRVG